MLKRSILTIAVLLLVVSSMVAVPQNSNGTMNHNISVPRRNSTVLVDAEFVVRPGQYRVWRFYVGERGASVVGRFRSDTNIEVYIMDDDALENWRNGATVKTYYSSGRITVANINVQLNEGYYNLVFSNVYSAISIKEIQAHIELQ